MSNCFTIYKMLNTYINLSYRSLLQVNDGSVASGIPHGIELEPNLFGDYTLEQIIKR
jgi:hypothetical protein